jgi:hypothetical protein
MPAENMDEEEMFLVRARGIRGGNFFVIGTGMRSYHYRNPRLCRVLASLPSAFYRTLGKDSFAERHPR